MKKFFLYTSIFVILDQIIKIVIRGTMEVFDSIIVIPNFLNITYVQNTGAAFSILEGQQLFFVIVSIIVVTGIIYYMFKTKLDKIDYFIFSLIISGIVGNVMDRICFNYVTDFIEFILFGKSMPIFNLADTFICVGFVLLLWKEEICKNLSIKKKKQVE